MRAIAARPLLAGCILYLVSLAALFCLSAVGGLAPAIVGAVCVGLVVLAVLRGKAKRKLGVFCFAVAVVVLLAFLQVSAVLRTYRTLQYAEEATVSVTGTVERIYYATDSGASFLLSLDTLDGARRGGSIVVESVGEVRYADAGSKISCDVILGEADLCAEYREDIHYLFPDGIYAQTRYDGNFTVLSEPRGFSAFCADLAAFCRVRLYRYLPQDAAGLVCSILFGDKSDLDPAVKRDFRRIGIAHVLAVSGLHLSILIGGLRGALGGLGTDRRIQLILMLVFLVIFMGMTGFSPSVLRAGIMWILYCLSWFVKSARDGLTALFFAAAVICFASPGAVFDIGLLLSVSATLGILVLAQPLNDTCRSRIPAHPWLAPLCPAISVLGMTLAATIFTLPVMAAAFGEISVISPISNLLLHLPVTILLYLSPLLLLLSLAAGAAPIGWVCGVLADIIAGDAALICDAAATLSKMEAPLVGVRYAYVWGLLLLFAAAAVLLLYRKKPLWLYAAFAVLCAAFALCLQIHRYVTRDDVVFTCSTHKKNDIVTVVSEGRGMLIDASDGSYTAARLGWEQLSEQNITDLDAYLLTHYHNRHTVTLSKLADTALIRALILPEPELEEERTVYESLCAIARERDIAVYSYRGGEDGIVFGDACLTVLPRAYLSRSTQPLIGYTAAVGEQRFVYLGGGAWESAEGGMFTAKREDAVSASDILVCGVHGPLYKTVFGADSDAAPEILYLANREIAALADPALISSAGEVHTAEDDGILRTVISAAP